MGNQERTNFFHLVADIAWFGLAFAVMNRFISFYAIRVGASPLEQGLVASLPGLVMLMSPMIAGWWRRRYSDSQQALMWPALGFRFVYLLPAFTPFFPAEWQPLWLILAVTLPALPQGIAAVIFLVMMREAVGDEHITRLTSRRMLALNVGLIISTLVFGLILKQMVFPQNYQVVFLMAFLFTLISQLHVMRVRIINPAPVAAPTRDNNMLALWRTPGFLKMALVIAAGFITFTSIIAVTPLYLVKGMGADEGFQAFFGVVELAAGITAATFVDRIIARYGNRSVIALMLAGTAVAAVIFAFAPSLNFMLIGAAVSGMTWTAASVALFGYFVENTPATEMGRWTAGYQQIVGLSTFIGPLLGSTLANSGVNLVIVLLFGAALRLGAAVLIHYNVVSFFRAHVHLPKLASVK